MNESHFPCQQPYLLTIVGILHLLCYFSFQATRTNILDEICESKTLIGKLNPRARILPDRSNKQVLLRSKQRMHQEMISLTVSLKCQPHTLHDNMLLSLSFCRLHDQIRCQMSLKNLQAALQLLFFVLRESWFECAGLLDFLRSNLRHFVAAAFDNPWNTRGMRWVNLNLTKKSSINSSNVFKAKKNLLPRAE